MPSQPVRAFLLRVVDIVAPAKLNPALPIIDPDAAEVRRRMRSGAVSIIEPPVYEGDTQPYKVER